MNVSFSSRFSPAHSRSCSSYASPVTSAFWKIDGFEVTPTTASSRISRSSSPPCTDSRDRLSIQTDTPAPDSSCSLESAMRHLPFHRGDLLKPRHVALAAVEPRGDECAYQLRRERRPDDLGAEAEDVHVVVLHALVRGVDVVAYRRADPGDLAGGDARADTGAADEDAALGIAAQDRLADLPRLVRVVDPRRVGVGAEVDGVAAGVGERREHLLAQVDAAVVERGRDPHSVP